MTEKELIFAAADAVALGEGFFAEPKKGAPPAVVVALRNPGAMRAWRGPDGEPYPTLMDLVQFPTVADGWRALRAQCRINIVKRRLTAREFFHGRRGVYRGYRTSDPSARMLQLVGAIASKAGRPVDLDEILIELIEGTRSA